MNPQNTEILKKKTLNELIRTKFFTIALGIVRDIIVIIISHSYS